MLSESVEEIIFLLCFEGAQQADGGGEEWVCWGGAAVGLNLFTTSKLCAAARQEERRRDVKTAENWEKGLAGTTCDHRSQPGTQITPVSLLI